MLPKVSTIYTSLDCGGVKRDASNEPCYILSKGQIAAGLSWEATGEFTADRAPGTAKPSSALPALCPWGPRACGEQHPTHSPSEEPDSANFSSIILPGNPTHKQGPGALWGRTGCHLNATTASLCWLCTSGAPLKVSKAILKSYPNSPTRAYVLHKPIPFIFLLSSDERMITFSKEIFQ